MLVRSELPDCGARRIAPGFGQKKKGRTRRPSVKLVLLQQLLRQRHFDGIPILVQHIQPRLRHVA